MRIFIKFFTKISNKLKYKMISLRELIYVLIDSKLIIGKAEKVLFIDLGANLGQGYSWFSRFFKKHNIVFELFEPNPNCFEKLRDLQDLKRKNIILNNLAVGLKQEEIEFYGLHIDKYSQGGSLIKEHNSKYYESNEQDSIKVKVIDFKKFLLEKKGQFDKIIVKFDIEGIEIEILEDLIDNNIIQLINILYVEFHSKYCEPNISKLRRQREIKIINHIKELKNVHLRLWH